MRLKVKILVLVSKHETDEKKSRSCLETWDCKIKFSFSSRSTRPRDRNSRSRLEAWDWQAEILNLVSKHETERRKFSISSQSMRLKGRNSRSRLKAWDWKEEVLESWKRPLAMLWLICICRWHCMPPALGNLLIIDLGWLLSVQYAHKWDHKLKRWAP